MSSEWLAPPDFQAMARHALRSRYRAAFSAATAHSSFPRKDTTSSADTGAASSPPPPPAAAAAAAAARPPGGGATRPPPRAPDILRPPPPPLRRPALAPAHARPPPPGARVGRSPRAGGGWGGGCSAAVRQGPIPSRPAGAWRLRAAGSAVGPGCPSSSPRGAAGPTPHTRPQCHRQQPAAHRRAYRRSTSRPPARRWGCGEAAGRARAGGAHGWHKTRCR